MAHINRKFRDVLANSQTESRALMAMRSILLAGAAGRDATFPIEDTIRTIAAAARTEALQSLAHKDALGPLAHMLPDELPFPVLARTGQGHLEVQWTQYLAHAFRFGNDGGNEAGPLGRVFATKFSGGESSGPHTFKVHDEVYLDELGGKGWVIDLLFESEHMLIAVEHKTVSGPSNAKRRDGSPITQAESQLELLSRRAGKRKLVPVWLSLSGTRPPDWAEFSWRDFSHGQLAALLVDEVAKPDAGWSRSFLRFVRAFLVDLVECHGQGLHVIYDAIAQWQHEPGNYALAVRLLEQSRSQCELFKTAKKIMEVCYEQ